MAQKCRFPQAAAPSGGCEVGRVPSDCVLLLELWVVLFGCVLFLAILSALCLPLFCLLPLISPPATLGLLLAWSTRCLLWPACLFVMYVASSAIIHRTSRGHAEHVAAGGRPAIEAEIADWVGSTGSVRCSETASLFFVLSPSSRSTEFMMMENH